MNLAIVTPSMEGGVNSDDEMWCCELLEVDDDENAKVLNNCLTTCCCALTLDHAGDDVSGTLCTWFSLMLFLKMVAPLVHFDDPNVSR